MLDRRSILRLPLVAAVLAVLPHAAKSEGNGRIATTPIYLQGFGTPTEEGVPRILKVMPSTIRAEDTSLWITVPRDQILDDIQVQAQRQKTDKDFRFTVRVPKYDDDPRREYVGCTLKTVNVSLLNNTCRLEITFDKSLSF